MAPFNPKHLPPQNSIGLIAGAGELPLQFSNRARQKGYRVVVAAIRGSASQSLGKKADAVAWLSLGQLGGLLSFFKKQGVRKAVMLGKVQHSQLFRHLRLDLKALAVWSRLKDRSGEGLLKAVAKEMQGSGVKLMDCRTHLEDLLAKKGWLTQVGPKKDELSTIAYGLRQARALARLKVGQLVVVKGNAVVSVEGMEGSDETIRRAGRWAGPRSIVVKVASPKQDWRFDAPTVGPQTLQSLIRARARGLVVEAGRTLLLQREKTLALAQKNGIFILGM